MHYKSIGVTATRQGLSTPQKLWLKHFVEDTTANVLHHGDCIGGDEEVVEAFHFKGTYIIAHPGNSRDRYKAYSSYNDLILTWRENLERNKEIVNASNLMLAFPLTEHETVRSGTWATIRYMMHSKKEYLVVLPSGLVIKST